MNYSINPFLSFLPLRPMALLPLSKTLILEGGGHGCRSFSTSRIRHTQLSSSRRGTHPRSCSLHPANHRRAATSTMHTIPAAPPPPPPRILPPLRGSVGDFAPSTDLQVFPLLIRRPCNMPHPPPPLSRTWLGAGWAAGCTSAASSRSIHQWYYPYCFTLTFGRLAALGSGPPRRKTARSTA